MKLVLLLTALFSMASFAILTAPYSNSYDSAGKVMSQEAEWIVVKNIGGSTVNQGDMVVLDTTAAATTDGIGVSRSTSVYARPLCMVDQTIVDQATGKCLKYGYTGYLYHVATTGSATAGNMIYTAATAGAAQGLATAVASQFPIGVWLESTGSKAHVKAYIML